METRRTCSTCACGAGPAALPAGARCRHRQQFREAGNRQRASRHEETRALAGARAFSDLTGPGGEPPPKAESQMNSIAKLGRSPRTRQEKKRSCATGQMCLPERAPGKRSNTMTRAQLHSRDGSELRAAARPRQTVLQAGSDRRSNAARCDHTRLARLTREALAPALPSIQKGRNPATSKQA